VIGPAATRLVPGRDLGRLPVTHLAGMVDGWVGGRIGRHDY